MTKTRAPTSSPAVPPCVYQVWQSVHTPELLQKLCSTMRRRFSATKYQSHIHDDLASPPMQVFFSLGTIIANCAIVVLPITLDWILVVRTNASIKSRLLVLALSASKHLVIVP
ncbi:hypothetical protein B0H14DRAFT_2593954 [Mycena olivaceomarginata]|nr:hypothetical protein B0H14DRAFT_2593954 [Mycena olivaceomarginata]